MIWLALAAGWILLTVACAWIIAKVVASPGYRRDAENLRHAFADLERDVAAVLRPPLERLLRQLERWQART